MNLFNERILSASNWTPLRELAKRVGLTALDVGARGGVSNDLLPLASAVDYYGFEPDPAECDRLNSDGIPHPWKQVTFFPTALNDSDNHLDLHLYRQRGCSSVLTARREMARQFKRENYYDHEGDIKIKAQSLDKVIDEQKIESPAYMKIDVQGMEDRVFQGAKDALSHSLVGIRTEVSFFPLYEGQPLFAEIDQLLRPYGFVPMRWLELHAWRRSTLKKYPASGNGPYPYSFGQMIHGDVLYLMHPEAFVGGSANDARRLIRLGLIAACYGHIDHAHSAFSHPLAKAYLSEESDINPLVQLQKISRQMAARARLISLGNSFLKLRDKMTK